MRKVLTLILFYYVLTTIAVARAQQTVGGVLGIVTDSSGAVVPAAHVELMSTGTGLSRSVEGKANGEYAFNDVLPGTYEVTVTRAGFDTAKLSDVLVQVGRVTTLDVKLKVGSASTSIDVNGTPSLNTVDTTNGIVLDAGQIEAVPLATGSFTQLATLAPGVSAGLLSGTGTNEGLGNQNLYANGSAPRATHSPSIAFSRTTSSTATLRATWRRAARCSIPASRSRAMEASARTPRSTMRSGRHCLRHRSRPSRRYRSTPRCSMPPRVTPRELISK